MSIIDVINRVRNYEPTRIPEPVNNPVQPETSPTAYRTRAYEQNFAAEYLANRLSFWRDPDQPAPTPTPQTEPFQTSGSGTETTYTVGDPTRPDIQHDNGFLQNPDDPNDPNPIPTVEPSQSDRDFYESELSKVTWAQRGDNFNIPFVDDPTDEARRLEDGIEAYRHFLEGNGADRTFSYEEFVEEDESGQTVLNNAIADTQRGAEALYNLMVAEDPSLAGQIVTFDVTSGVITVGSGEEYPYPDSENWQKAIGGHSIWNSATVTVTPSEDGGEPQFSMDYTLHAEDRYNFNPNQEDIATGQPDAIRGEQLEKTGLAEQYMQYATLEREVTWTQGDISGTTETENLGEGR